MISLSVNHLSIIGENLRFSAEHITLKVDGNSLCSNLSFKMSYSLSSYPSTVHGYPMAAAPPTTNALSPHQCSHLRRSTQKLGRLLGSTPALIEQQEMREYSLTRPPTPPHPAPHPALLHLHRRRRPCAVPLLKSSRSSSESSEDNDEYAGRRTDSAHVATTDCLFLRIAPPYPHAPHSSYTF
ncbi:hypothetical protein DFH09DRAFT_1326787 [Mycena vulgaris]|nr:hypothetical protein DFH09DRAFT_1326787 [Mycena vulgaris]